jgi:hypothetical protein
MINKISRLDGGTAEALEAIFIALTSSNNDYAGFSGALDQLRQMAVKGEKLDYTLDMHAWISALEMLALANQEYSPLAKQVLEAIMANSAYGKEAQNYAMLALRNDAQKDGGEKDVPQAPANVGGIDFRGLPITSFTAVNPALMAVPAHLAGAGTKEMNAAWSAIQKKMQSGPVPFEDLAGYVAACSQRKECRSQLKAVSSYILNMLKLEEEAAVATAPELKEILSCLS